MIVQEVVYLKLQYHTNLLAEIVFSGAHSF